MNNGHRQQRFGINKFVGNQLSFGQMGINNHSSTLNTFVGTKGFMPKEDLADRPMKYSQLVGGFVGSKSQLGTSNRISCQIWDIVFCKLMSFMNSTNMKSASSLGNSEYSYAFVQDLATNMFDSMYRDISENNTPPADSCAVTTEVQDCNNLASINSEKHNLKNVSVVLNKPFTVPHQEFHTAALKDNCKQSYAEVTKTAKHTMAKGNAMHENVICPKSTVKTNNVEMIPVSELNNNSKRKKQNCRRKKANIPDFNIVKPQNSCKNGGSKYKNDHRKMANLKVQNAMKKQKNISASNMKKEAPENVECDVNDMLIFTDKLIDENSSLKVKEAHRSCKPLLPKNKNSEFEFMAQFEKNCAYPHMMVIPKDTSKNCCHTDAELQNNSIKEEDVFLPNKPSFSHVNEMCSPQRNRFHSDSSDSDDFVIFAVAETEMQVESASEGYIRDCFSDCDTEEIWDSQEKYTDDDNQEAENLRTINEKWEKMYSCFPGMPKEPKKVQFASNEKLKTVHSIIAWDFAYRAARIGCWQQIALDQERFMRRILQLEQIISPVLTTEHRLCVQQRILKYLNNHSEC